MKTTRAIQILVLLLLPSLLLSCTRMKIIDLGDHPGQRVQHWTQVQVYQDIGEITQSYQEIAVLEVSSAVTRKKMLHDIQRRAAGLGADGIVLEHVGQHKESSFLFLGNALVPFEDERWDGQALVIRLN